MPQQQAFVLLPVLYCLTAASRARGLYTTPTPVTSATVNKVSWNAPSSSADLPPPPLPPTDPADPTSPTPGHCLQSTMETAEIDES